MKILFLGDVMGRSGREGIVHQLPRLKEIHKPDAIIVNAENAAGGYGLTMKIADEFFALGVSCLTLGNHAWSQRELMTSIDREPRIVRPLNYPKGTPGQPFYEHTLADGRTLVVVNPVTQLFMDVALDSPFAAMDAFVGAHRLSGRKHIFVDIHGEATSEKMAMGHFLDGRATAVVGTHTHIPTADEHVLPRGTAFMADAGMCGDFDSIIGMQKEAPLWKFTKKTPFFQRMEPAKGIATVCGAVVTSDDETGLAQTIEPVRVGGVLRPTV